MLKKNNCRALISRDFIFLLFFRCSDTATSPVKMVPLVTTTTDANSAELDEFVTTLRTQLEIFVNRMKSNSSRGRSITNDSSVQTLFMNTMAMHSKLLRDFTGKDQA